MSESAAASAAASNGGANPLSVPADECPDCGGLKIKQAKRCKACHNVALKGVPRTDSPSEGTSRYRARQLCPKGPCTYDGCSAEGAQVHHIDGDPFNNDPANLTRLCVRHHMTVDGRLEATRERAARVGREFGGRPKAKETSV